MLSLAMRKSEAYIDHIVRGELDASAMSASQDHVCHVSGVGIPSKVSEAVVAPIAIFVAALMARRWLADECQEYESVDIES